MINDKKIKLYENVKLSLNFDFYSPLSRKKLADSIAKYTKKNTKFCNKYLDEALDSGTIRICRNDFGGNKMHQIQTGFLPYYEAVNIAFKLFDCIDYYGYTNGKCKAKTSIKVNTKALKLPNISQINTLKLINSIDECNLSDKWYKNSHEKLYLNSLLYIYPTDVKLMGENYNNFINFKDFKYPSSNKFNIVFEDLKDDIVSVRFIKYKDYQKQKNTFNTHINEMINSVCSTLNNNLSYTDNEISKIKRVMSFQRNIMESIWTFDDLKKNHKNVNILVDLKESKDVISVHYPMIRQKLFELMSYCSFNKGSINYDTERNSIQVKDADITNGHHISDVEFYYSQINGVMNNCKFYECEVKNSKLTNCELFYGTDIKNSSILNTKFHGIDINLYECFVKNPNDLLVEANIYNTIVMGVMNYSSYIDENSEILDY